MTNAQPDLDKRLRGIGISRPYAHQLANRQRTPSLRLARRIERELGIAVSYWDTTPRQEGAR